MEKSEIIGLVMALLILSFFLGNRFGPVMPVTFSLAVGSSMFPTISNGEMLVAVSKQLVDIRPGDIAIYKNGQEFVVHRVIEINGNYAIFKGDNNLISDGIVPLSNVYYKVVAILPVQVWVPAFALLFSGYGIFLIYRRNKLSKDKSALSEVYSVSTLLYFTAVLAFAIGLTLNTISTTTYMIVKPNPLPTIEMYDESDHYLIVEFTQPLDSPPACKASLTGSPFNTISLPCGKSGKKVIIDLSRVESVCRGPCTVEINISYKVDSRYYDVTVTYPITTVVGG